MKKKYLLVICFLILCFVFKLEVKAAEVTFPNKIKCYIDGDVSKNNRTVTNYNVRIYKKYCNVNGEKVKALCSTFKYQAPHGLTCESKNWNRWGKNNKQKKAISYAVGHIIKESRKDELGNLNNGDGVNSYTKGYTLSELNVNRLLYYVASGGKSNDELYKLYMSFPLQISGNAKKKFNDLLSESKKIYNSIENNKPLGSVEITETKDEIKTKIQNTGKLKFTINCTDELGKDRCNSPTAKISIYKVDDDGKNKEPLTKTNSLKPISNSAGKAKFELDVRNFTTKRTNELDSGQSENIEFSIEFSHNLKYYKTQNYICKDKSSVSYQPLTLNLVKDVQEELNDNISVSIKNIGTGTESETKQISCASFLDRAKRKYKDNGDLENYYKALQKIYELNNTTTITAENNPLMELFQVKTRNYQCSDCEKNTNNEILNISNPSCSQSGEAITFDCEKIEYNNYFLLDNQYSSDGISKVYCSYNLQIDYSGINNQQISKGDLLFYSDDGIIGNGTVKINCGNNLKTGYSVLPIVSSIPLKITVGGDVMTLNAELYQTGEIVLRESNWKHFDFQKKMSWNQFSNVKSDIYMGLSGYGMPNVNQNLENFKIALQSNSFGYKVDQSERFFDINLDDHPTCSFKITDENIEQHLIYRSVDVDNPFINYQGQKRNTGNNWCFSGDDNLYGNIENGSLNENTTLINVKNVYVNFDNGDLNPIFDINENGYIDIIDFIKLKNSSLYVAVNPNYVNPITGENIVDIRGENIKVSGFLNSFTRGGNSKLIFASEEDFNDPLNDYDYVEQWYGTKEINDKLTNFVYDNEGNEKYINYYSVGGVYEFEIYKLFENIMSSESDPKLVKVVKGDLNLDGIRDPNDEKILKNILEQGTSVLDADKQLSIFQQYTADCDNDGYITNDDLMCVNDSNDETGVSVEENIGVESSFLVNCTNENNALIDNYITNAPNSNGYKTNSDGTKTKVKPLYSIVLTPENIKNIRNYNKRESVRYNDFRLSCTDGKKCVSKFITDLLRGENGMIKVSASGQCIDNVNYDSNGKRSFCEVEK